jgi:hypothetical protein
VIDETTTNVHASSGIQTHDLSVQAIKAQASDRAAIGTGLRSGGQWNWPQIGRSVELASDRAVSGTGLRPVGQWNRPQTGRSVGPARTDITRFADVDVFLMTIYTVDSLTYVLSHSNL